jgi:hypothetical protein
MQSILLKVNDEETDEEMVNEITSRNDEKVQTENKQDNIYIMQPGALSHPLQCLIETAHAILKESYQAL